MMQYLWMLAKSESPVENGGKHLNIPWFIGVQPSFWFIGFRWPNVAYLHLFIQGLIVAVETFQFLPGLEEAW